MIWGRQKQLEELLKKYMAEVRETVSSMVTVFERCSGEYDNGFLVEALRDVHSHESNADDVRREIEVMMYAKALFPEARGDVLSLVENIDKIANQSQKAVWMMQSHHLTIPLQFQSSVLLLAKVSADAGYALLDAAEKLFIHYGAAAEMLGKVDHLESEADKLEANLTEQVFLSDIEGLKKILMRDLIHYVGKISDNALTVADRIRIMIAKRSI